LTQIRVENLVKTFERGKIKAVDHVSLTVEGGKLLTLLGPSGCGKSTTLRCIAGLEVQESGNIFLGTTLVSSPEKGIYLPPEKRGLGMVFQSYAVWPHMTVFENVAFPLKRKGVRREDIKKKVSQAIHLVGLEGLEERFPTKLSGGQQQRVSFARAVVGEPRALLFDEPLSNLDAKLRERMRFEIVSLQKKLGVTTVYVTHDQAEAMVISDQVAVMDRGLIMQIGTPREIYENPENKFIAGFIGFTNFITGRVLRRSSDQKFWVLDCPEIKAEISGISSKSLQPGQEVEVSVRPEHIQIFPPPSAEPLNRIKGQLEVKTYLGEYNDCLIRVSEKLVRVKASPELELSPGQTIDLYLNPNKLNILTS